MVLSVSIPRSDLEMNPDDQRDHDAIKKLCDRVGKAILMSADKEMSEIIRRRLFEWEGLTNEAKATVSAYAEWAADHADQLVGVDRDGVYEQFKALTGKRQTRPSLAWHNSVKNGPTST